VKNVDWNNKHIVISRTDSIGDVILTLPVCAKLKELYPHCTITFLCKRYTAAIVKNYQCVDHILLADDLQKDTLQEQIQTISNSHYDAIVHVFPNKQFGKLFKKAKVKYRIGTSHRIHHWFSCNIRPRFTRKGSHLHESQLNFKLLSFFGIQAVPSLEKIKSYNKHFQVPSIDLHSEVASLNFENTICLHPKSQGSAVEWPMENYVELASKLVENGKTVCFTGTDKEGDLFRDLIPKHERIVDSTGKLNINQLQYLIKESHGLVACSTGPLHIAAILERKAVGLFCPRIPIHPGRWMPLGSKAVAVVNDSNCEQCNKGLPCDCITKITVEKVYNELNK